MGHLGERLKHYRRLAGLTQDDVAAKLRRTRQAISQWERGEREPSYEDLRELARLYGVSVATLLGETPVSSDIIPDVVPVPILGTIHAGDPAWASQEPEGWALIPADLARTGDFFALRVKGDCFAYGRKPIDEGDIVLVRKQPEVDNGQIAVVYWPDQEEAVLRRVERKDGMVILRADNPKYPVEVVRNRDLTILGRVVKVIADPSTPDDL